MTMRAALYLRRSTDEHQVESLNVQEKGGGGYIASQRWTLDPRHVFTDDAKSRAEFQKRTGLLALLAAAQRREFDVVVTRDESRLGGDTFRTGVVIQDLLDSGVRLFYYFTKEEVTFDEPTAKVIVAVRSYASELERLKTSQRTYEHLETKAREARNVGGRCYGYDNVPKMKNAEEHEYVDYQINPDQAKVVVFIYEKYAEGWGLREIAKELNDRGVPCPKVGKRGSGYWKHTTIFPMLRRQRYRGVIVWGAKKKTYQRGTKVRVSRPESELVRTQKAELRIVSEELWAAVQARIAKNRRENKGCRAPRGAPPKYLLSGLSRCTCGGAMKVSNGKDGKRPIKVYGCSAHRDGGNKVCANTLRRPVELVDAAVLDWVKENVLQEEAIVQALRELRRRLSARMGTLNEDVPRLEAEARRLKKEIAKLADSLLCTKEKPRIIVEKIAEREEKLNELQARIASMRTAPQVLDLEARRMEKEARRRIADLRAVMARNPEEAKRVLVALLDGKLTFTPTETKEGRRYAISGKVATGALLHRMEPAAAVGQVHETERPQRESNPR